MKRLHYLFASYFDANRRNYTPLGIKQGSNNGIIPDGDNGLCLVFQIKLYA